jgi:hypothetical protein
MSFFKSKFTEEEVKIQDMVRAFVAKPNTLIEINPEDMSYILSYEPKSYYILVDSVGVQITNHTFDKDIRLESYKVDVIKSIIKEEATKRREAKKALIFKNRSELLDKITSNLTFDGN